MLVGFLCFDYLWKWFCCYLLVLLYFMVFVCFYCVLVLIWCFIGVLVLLWCFKWYFMNFGDFNIFELLVNFSILFLGFYIFWCYFIAFGCILWHLADFTRFSGVFGDFGYICYFREICLFLVVLCLFWVYFVVTLCFLYIFWCDLGILCYFVGFTVLGVYYSFLLCFECLCFAIMVNFGVFMRLSDFGFGNFVNFGWILRDSLLWACVLRFSVLFWWFGSRVWGWYKTEIFRFGCFVSWLLVVLLCFACGLYLLICCWFVVSLFCGGLLCWIMLVTLFSLRLLIWIFVYFGFMI